MCFRHHRMMNVVFLLSLRTSEKKPSTFLKKFIQFDSTMNSSSKNQI